MFTLDCQTNFIFKFVESFILVMHAPFNVFVSFNVQLVSGVEGRNISTDKEVLHKCGKTQMKML